MEHLRRWLMVGVAAVLAVVVAAMGTQPTLAENSKHKAEKQQQSIENSVDWGQVSSIIGKSGKMQEGPVYEIDLPRTDQTITVQGTRMNPSLDEGEIYFVPLGGGQVVMHGEFAVLMSEVPGVEAALRDSGIEIAADHHHLLNEQPQLVYLHFSARGDALQIARALKVGLSQSATPTTETPDQTNLAGLPTSQLDSIIGDQGKAMDGMYQYSIEREDTISDMGIELPSASGVEVMLNFQPMGGNSAAVTGEMPLLASEVNPVISALEHNGIAVTAVHNHMLGEQPRLFYLHFWATGNATDIAKGLKAALDQVNIKKS